MKNKQRLIILSDLWGIARSPYLQEYVKTLQNKLDVYVYDSCHLGKVSTQTMTEENLHQQFVNGGIDEAVKQLIALEKENSPLSVLAFSIGGTIAWKAALKGLELQHLWAISSTRLRHETTSPKCGITLLFGEEDAYRPSHEWFHSMQLSDYQLIEHQSHDLYKLPSVRNEISSMILDVLN